VTKHPIYDLFRNSPPSRERKTTQTCAYWKGYDNVPIKYVAGSVTWWAYKAGRDNATADNRFMTLLDGTIVRKGDKVRAEGEGTGLRVCTVLEIMKGTGVDKAVLTAPIPFGTVIRSRYQIKKLQ